MRRDPVRTAGVLLLIGCCLDWITWEIEKPWGWAPATITIADAALQAVLGLGLILHGRAWALATLVFLAASAVAACVTSVLGIQPLLQDQAVVVLTMTAFAPLVIGVLRILPFLLLLRAEDTSRRDGIAFTAYVFYQLVHLALVGVNLYVWQRFR